MHRSRRHHWLLACAWLAILLMLIAPLVSRALKQSAASASSALNVVHQHGSRFKQTPRHQHHHDAVDVLETASISSNVYPHHDADDETANARPMPGPHAEHDMGVDCDYCVIAARLISLLIAVLLLLTGCPGSFGRLARLANTRLSLLKHLGCPRPPFRRSRLTQRSGAASFPSLLWAGGY
ncbi:DUF2946 family protein [Xanthomonas campestris]|uniref:DUF2946 family protein n=1 Tax=Xanthomonas campestris TaxID=339 RepID=UPI003D064C7B